ncbi:hypothetical protein D9M72_549880 [compost metagenome]
MPAAWAGAASANGAATAPSPMAVSRAILRRTVWDFLVVGALDMLVLLTGKDAVWMKRAAGDSGASDPPGFPARSDVSIVAPGTPPALPC